MKKLFIFALFTIISSSVMADDFKSKEACMRKELLSFKKALFKECKISETFLNDDDVINKVPETQKKCIMDYSQENQKELQYQIQIAMKKCNV